MDAVAAQSTVLVEQHMGRGGDDVVAERQLPGAARVAAVNDPGRRVASLDVAEVSCPWTATS